MTLIDRIEFLGSAVDDGLIDLDAAADLLLEHADGHLSMPGAVYTLENHRVMRQRGPDAIADVEAAIRVISAVRAATTAEEYLAAHNAMLAEYDRQRQAFLERNRHGIGGLNPGDLP